MTNGSLKPRVVVVMGTRPELVKMAEAVRCLREAETLDVVVAFTGQHAELMAEAAGAFGVIADITIPPLQRGRSLTDLLAHAIGEIGRAPELQGAACVVVQGDTASALAGALVSEMMAIPLIHVEAGVRSRLRDDPFPEETVRRIISPITELHLCFSQATRNNLLSEGVHEDVIAVVPHPVRDRVFRVADLPPRDNAGGEILMTLHRRERRRERAEHLVDLIRWLRREQSHLAVVFVWHPSLDDDLPDLRRWLEHAGARIMPPMPPDSFLQRLARSALVVTDSAGVAEEAQLLSKPLVIFRASAEIRLDDAPSAPICATESDIVAAEFIRGLGHLVATVPTPTQPLVSAGRIIACVIEAFALGGVSSSKMAWAPTAHERDRREPTCGPADGTLSVMDAGDGTDRPGNATVMPPREGRSR